MDVVQFLWWHWMVLGIVLVLLELAVPAFFLVWIACSIAFIWLWFKVFKPGIYKTRAGMSKGAVIGEVGLVIRDIRPFEKGQIRFQKPVLGDEVWESIADEEIRAGERVKVLDVEGNILKVGRT